MRVLRDVRDSARRREGPTINMARKWQRETMAGLDVPDPQYIGRFRGEPGLEMIQVSVGSKDGVLPSEVGQKLAAFELRLQRVVAALDERYPATQELDGDGLAAVVDLSAWAHSEWIRIHPFANGNGRTARIWANFLLMRYGVPPFVRLRPTPDGGYAAASARAMDSDWKSTASVFRQMLREFLMSEPRETRSSRRK